MGSNTLTDQRADVLAKAKTIIDRAKTAGRDFTADEQAEVERHHAEVKDIDRKLKGQRLVNDVLSLSSADDNPDGGPGLKALSPSQWAAKAARRMRGVTDDDSGAVPTKSVQSGSWTLPATLTDYVRDPDRATRLLELVPRKPATANYGFIRQVTRTNNAAFVADAATKPTSVFAFEEVLDHLRTLAHLSEPIPIRFDTDYTDHMELVRTELVNGLMPKLEDQVINGDGLGENLTGILQTSGITVQAFATNIPTTLRKARTGLEQLDETPNAWVFNPADAETLDLTRTDEGGAGTGDFLSWDRILGDIPFVVARGLPPGNALLGDFRQSRLYVGEQTRFDVDTSGALFDSNSMKMRAEGRFGLAVLRPQAFCTVDLAA